MAVQPSATTDIRKQFAGSGFEVKDLDKAPESFEVSKNNCTETIERGPHGAWQPAGRPRFTVRGLACELEDRGYQKFWHHQGKRFPIRLADLRTLHHFDEEVRHILGFQSLYNESLGSTCSRTAYDRMHGRPDA
jgi:hypothetical protein